MIDMHKKFLDLIVAANIELDHNQSVETFYDHSPRPNDLFGGVDAACWAYIHIPITYTHHTKDGEHTCDTMMVVASNPYRGFTCIGPVNHDDMLTDMDGLIMMSNIKRLLIGSQLRFHTIRRNRDGVPFNDEHDYIEIALRKTTPATTPLLTRIKDYMSSVFNPFKNQPHHA